MIKKLKNRRGTSIAEMLVAVVVLALLTAGGITAASSVLAGYNRMKEAANADILASTVIEALSNEVRLGHELKVADPANTGILTLDSAFFGEGAQLKLGEGEDAGHLVAVPAGSDPKVKELLSEDTYSGLKLNDLTFNVTEKAGSEGRTMCTFTFTVLGSSGNVLWNNSASAATLQW